MNGSFDEQRNTFGWFGKNDVGVGELAVMVSYRRKAQDLAKGNLVEKHSSEHSELHEEVYRVRVEVLVENQSWQQRK